MENTARVVTQSASSAFVPGFIARDLSTAILPNVVSMYAHFSQEQPTATKTTIMVIDGEMHVLQEGVPPELSSAPPGGPGLISMIGIGNEPG